MNKGKTSSIMKNVNNGCGSKRLARNADAENRKRFLASAFFKSGDQPPTPHLGCDACRGDEPYTLKKRTRDKKGGMSDEQAQG